MSEPAPLHGTEPRESPRKRPFISCGGCALGLVTLFLLAGIAIGPTTPGGIRYAHNYGAMQQGRQIGQMLFSYATDNTDKGNAYPDGNSSTEVFQKLIDGGYCSDPAVFYVPLPGKVKPVVGQKLKPENVCWDLTSGVAADAPSGLPLVFLTGYKVTYRPGAAAIPLIKPYPHYWATSTWWGWFKQESNEPPGIAVFYKGNNAMFINLNRSENPDGSVPNFVPKNFDANGVIYRQLTPDGPLP